MFYKPVQPGLERCVQVLCWLLLPPALLEGQQGLNLAIIWSSLPASRAHGPQCLRGAQALADQDGAALQRSASDPVLAVDEHLTAFGELVQRPVRTTDQLLLRQLVPIWRRQMEQTNPKRGERLGIVRRLLTGIDDGRYTQQGQPPVVTTPRRSPDREVIGDPAEVEVGRNKVGGPFQQTGDDAEP